jgi:hypothetical protein
MHKCLSAALAGLVVSSLAAQGGVIAPSYAELWGNGCNSLPYGRTYHRYHQLYEPASLPTSLTVGKKIASMGWRRCSTTTTSHPAVTIDIEASLYSVALTQASMSTTFAVNRAAGTGGIVFTQKKVNLPPLPLLSPSNTYHMLPFDNVHTFAGPGLLVEVVATDTTAASTLWNVDMCLGTTAGAAGNFGLGCGPTANTIGSTGAYMPGATFSVTQASGPASMPAVNMVGFSASFLVPNVPLPLDLTPLGATNCMLYTSIYFSFPTVLDGSGTGSISISVPNDQAFSGFKFNSQWLNAHPAAPAGFSLSAGRRFEIGPIDCAMAYMYRFSDNMDTTGSKFTNRGQVLRLVY